jgi:UPF0716 protein FxsA
VQRIVQRVCRSAQELTMFLRLFLIFAIIPIIEIWLLIRVGSVIGALPTVAILIAISMTGAWLARSQGFTIIGAIRDELAAGRMPAAHILDGAIIMAGGILLLTPGFFTDFIGLFFLIPSTRQLLKGWLRSWLEQKYIKHEVTIIHR